MKKNLFKIFIILFLLIIFFIINIKYYVSAVSNNLNQNIFRLHIIANSNSTKDQELKLKVRDSIIKYIKELQKNYTNKEDIINIINSNIKTIENISKQTIKDNGFNYDVTIEIGESYFPTKHYGNISLPAGIYDSLKIKIGSASGENWWCSLFPPLCFTELSSGIIDDKSNSNLKENLNNEEYSIITNTSTQYKFKFKLIEILNIKNIL